MPPTVMAAPVHPAGKRAGSMLMRLTRTLVPFVRASPAAGAAGAVTRGGGQAHVRARARRPRRVELAGGRAAVAIQRVAVVALLARLDHAVAADRGLLPHEVEEVRLDAAGRQPRPLDAE